MNEPSERNRTGRTGGATPHESAGPDRTAGPGPGAGAGGSAAPGSRAGPQENAVPGRTAEPGLGAGAGESAGPGPGAGPRESTGPGVAELQARVGELEEQVTDVEDRWRRALADLDNLRKRVIRDVDRVRDDERARAAGEWLPVLDNLERALEHSDTDPASIVEGLKVVRDQAQDVLARLGFARRDDAGAMFDPARHEAVAVLAQEDAPEGSILHVLRPAYGDGERQLRPALVVVAKGE
jgi:molecular chaperone GrpE